MESTTKSIKQSTEQEGDFMIFQVLSRDEQECEIVLNSLISSQGGRDWKIAWLSKKMTMNRTFGE